jgi:hypothetical protein
VERLNLKIMRDVVGRGQYQNKITNTLKNFEKLRDTGDIYIIFE